MTVDGKYLITANKAIADVSIIKTLSTGESPYGMAFNRDGKRLFVVAACAKGSASAK